MVNTVSKLLLLILASNAIIACSDKDEDLPILEQNKNTSTSVKDEPEKDRYYVRYEVSIINRWLNTTQTIKYTTENGINSIATTEDFWSGNFGPFEKGDKISLSINTIKEEYCHAYILVCRGSEPFVLKSEGGNNQNFSLSYIIDF